MAKILNYYYVVGRIKILRPYFQQKFMKLKMVKSMKVNRIHLRYYCFSNAWWIQIFPQNTCYWIIQWVNDHMIKLLMFHKHRKSFILSIFLFHTWSLITLYCRFYSSCTKLMVSQLLWKNFICSCSIENVIRSQFFSANLILTWPKQWRSSIIIYQLIMGQENSLKTICFVLYSGKMYMT